MGEPGSAEYFTCSVCRARYVEAQRREFLDSTVFVPQFRERRRVVILNPKTETLGGEPTCVPCWKDPFGRSELGRKRAVIAVLSGK